MDYKKLEEFIALAKKMGVSRLEYKNDDEKYVVELPYGQPLSTRVFTDSSPQPLADSSKPATSQKNEIGLKDITSPFVGTFYRSPSPQSPAFVKVGDKINTGSRLCIIEAMKIMNEIEAEFSGEIVEICAENETYVEFGQVLFKVRT